MKKCIFLLLGYTMSLCAMDEVVTIKVPFGRISRGCLQYQTQKYAEAMKKFGIPCEFYEPFIPLSYQIGEKGRITGFKKQNAPLSGSVELQPDGIGNIDYLPISVFKNNDGTWKQTNDLVAQLWNNGQMVQLVVADEIPWDTLLEHFENNPCYAGSAIVDHLIENKVLTKDSNGKLHHGSATLLGKKQIQMQLGAYSQVVKKGKDDESHYESPITFSSEQKEIHRTAFYKKFLLAVGLIGVVGLIYCKLNRMYL